MIAVSDRDRANGERYLHAWNIVQLGGQCYHLDATFDNSLSKYGPRYDYFNLDDTKIFRDHRPLLYPAPPCTDGGQFYYKLQHQSLDEAGGGRAPGRSGAAQEAAGAGVPLARRLSDARGAGGAVHCRSTRRRRRAAARRPSRSTGRRRCCRCASSMRPSRWKRRRSRTSEALSAPGKMTERGDDFAAHMHGTAKTSLPS